LQSGPCAPQTITFNNLVDILENIRACIKLTASKINITTRRKSIQNNLTQADLVELHSPEPPVLSPSRIVGLEGSCSQKELVLLEAKKSTNLSARVVDLPRKPLWKIASSYLKICQILGLKLEACGTPGR
jgi:hypothetical protein